MPTDLTRIEISIPLNDNTLPVINDFIGFILLEFNGCTLSRPIIPSPFQGYWLNPENNTMKEEDTMLMIIGVNPKQKNNFLDYLSMIDKYIKKTGEKESWITISSMTRYP